VTSFALAIPNKNQSRFIGTALESLQHQKAEYQLAVMDAGSTDGFNQALIPFREKVTYLRSFPDIGQAAAIEEGLANIDGDIVGWLNADDYYLPEALDKIVAFFDANPEIDVVYGDAIHVTLEGLFLAYFPSIQEFDAKTLTRTCFICQPACFVRRETYERVGGLNPVLQYTMDWDLWCRLSNSGAQFYYLQEVLAAVRYYPGTKTLSGAIDRYKEIWRIEKKYGHRIIPISLIGAYRFDLSVFQEKSRTESFLFNILNTIRKIKQKLTRHGSPFKKSKTKYGFYPLDSLVNGCGTIHHPWYDKRKGSILRLKVHPETDEYQITINGKSCDEISYKNGYLWIQLPQIENPQRNITICCKKTRLWRLLEFGCEFDNGTSERSKDIF
jgi:glycosyltransferase involved in cell wall biosynthesis